MPELPEVETIAQGLKSILKGRSFLAIKSSVPRAVIGKDFSKLKGQRVISVERRGKFINILFSDYVMTIHLRMSGRIIAEKPDAPALKFERTRIDFSGISLRFCDVRKFGRVWLNKNAAYEKATGIHKLGIEPLSPDFTLEKFLSLLRDRKGNIKSFLLNQSFIAGIGNIYADESLFYAGVLPSRKIESLAAAEKERLFKAIRKALQQGVKNRGTSISDFQDAHGKAGKNQEKLFVYGRGGAKCLKCGRPLKKAKIAGRGTVFCLICQS